MKKHIDKSCLQGNNVITLIKRFIKHKIKQYKKEETIMAQVTKKTLIGEALSIDEEIAPILMSIGMHCLGCPASQGESLEEACMVHGVDADELVKKINDFLASK